MTRHPCVGYGRGGCVAPITPRRIPMSCHPRVTAWRSIIQTRLPHLTKPHVTVLALWSLGMVLARSCALTAVRTFLATWLGRKEPAVRQQWRTCCSEATAKRGGHCGTSTGALCCVPLLTWVGDRWEGTPLALALDATTLGTRLTVLAIRVVSRGGAIPVAWTVLAATAKPALAAGVAASAAPGAACGAPRVDGARVGRPGRGCPLAVAAHDTAGVAPVFAHQHWWNLSAHRPGTWRASSNRGAPAGHHVAGDGDRLPRPSSAAPQHAVGVLGGGRHRPVVAPDGSATGHEYG